MTEAIVKQCYVNESLNGARFDQAAAELFPEYSRNLLKSWILSGQITLDGETQKPRVKVCANQLIEINAVPKQVAAAVAQSIELDIVYEDDVILILNKPAGLVVHPGAGNSDNTLLNALLHHCNSLNKVPRAGIVHRLDKETTGLMVVAKTLESHHFLIEAMQNRDIKREYQAVIQGQLISGGTVSAPIGRHPTKRTLMAVSTKGKPAITHYRIVEKFQHYTHIDVELDTGRTHQIRVHMQHLKKPLIGDKTYGGRFKAPKGASDNLVTTVKGFGRQALHAYRLTLPHPVSGQIMTFDAKLPNDIEDLLCTLRYDDRK